MNYSGRNSHSTQHPLLHPELWQLQRTESLQHQKAHTGRAKKSPAMHHCPISAPSPGRNRDSGELVAKVASESCESGQEVWCSLN